MRILASRTTTGPLVSLFRRRWSSVSGLRDGSGVPAGEEGDGDDEPGPGPGPGRKPPGECSVFLFPGQGSQFVGMCGGLLRYGAVRSMFAAAERILGYDLLALCLRGPEEELRRTVHCQPAVFLASLAAAVETCVAAAGFSVGEYAALVRAEAMQEASDRVPSGMLSVVGRPQAQYQQACLQALEHCRSLGVDQPVCRVANFLFPDGRVIAGHQQALDFLQQNSRRFQFVRCSRLPVSGAFHTPLMESACEPLRDVLRQIEVRRPEIRVYSNVDGKRYMHADHVRRQLALQPAAPVKWEQTLHEVYERAAGRAFPRTYELGPGRQLGATLQRVNLKAYRAYTHVDVVAESDEDH
ncbi:hypothetical protein CRUP_017269 [Coryphaenoides rupestris]|nr:hypothetical protein CRUP_017269 [Coryphaenoides rupestris]